MNTRPVVLGGCVVVGVILASSQAAFAVTGASFLGLGDLSGGSFQSIATKVSSDGTTVIGIGNSESGIEAFLWSSQNGIVGLGDLTGGNFLSAAIGVSANGMVAVGAGNVDFLGSQPTSEAFVWTASDGLVGLGDLPGGIFFSAATAVSADGATVVGMGNAELMGSLTTSEAFIWRASDGLIGLGDLPGGVFFSAALDVSADGTAVVGAGNVDSALSPSGTLEAFLWTSSNGMVGLGDLPGGDISSVALGISADGETVVGIGNLDSSQMTSEAFRWTASEGMVGLGGLSQQDSLTLALDVSADGSVVVGGSLTASGNGAFIWDVKNGIRSLKDVLVADFGVDLSNWQLVLASGVSADGLTIVGTGINPNGQTEAYIVTLPADTFPGASEDTDGDGVPDVSDNCPAIFNTNQSDSDDDGMGDACEPAIMLAPCPSDISVQATSQAGRPVDFGVPSASGGMGNAAVVVDPQPGSMFPIGITTVTVTATDSSGATVVCTFDVTVSAPTPEGQSNPDQQGSQNCGNGMCGMGTGMTMPFMLLGLGWMRRRRRSNLYCGRRSIKRSGCALRRDAP